MLVVWNNGTVWRMYYMSKYCLVVWYVSVYKVRKSRIRRTNIICEDLICRSLERTHMSSNIYGIQTDGQTNIHTDRHIRKYHNRDSVLQTENQASNITSENVCFALGITILRESVFVLWLMLRSLDVRGTSLR